MKGKCKSGLSVRPDTYNITSQFDFSVPKKLTELSILHPTKKKAKQDNTQETTGYSTLETHFRKGVNNVRIPARGHTQETTDYSTLETAFRKGVRTVNIPNRGHTQESTTLYRLASNFQEGVRTVSLPERGLT